MGLARTVDRKPPAMKNKWTERLCIALLIFVLALGIFVRVYRLGSWPPLYADEAAPGVRALRGLSGELEQTSGNRVYFSSAYVLMQMPFVRLLGNSLTALRLSSLVCGLLTILAAYMTARQLWDAKHALLAAAVAAILPLSVVIGGRLAWEPSMSFPVIAMALYFGVVAWQRHSVLAATACGLFLALGTYAHPRCDSGATRNDTGGNSVRKLAQVFSRDSSSLDRICVVVVSQHVDTAGSGEYRQCECAFFCPGGHRNW